MNAIRRNWLFISAAVLALGATALAISVGTLEPADFTFCNGTEIKSVDPAIVTGAPEGRIIQAIYEGLCTWDPVDLHPVPGVAESWEISEDGREYTFHLRKNARWSNGDFMTARDFAYSFRRLLHPATVSEYVYQMWYVKNAKKYTSLDVMPGDPVEIELEEQEEGALPFAPGKVIKGVLVSKAVAKPESKDSADSKTATVTDADTSEADPEASTRPTKFVVKIDGQEQTFDNTDPNAKKYKWLLLDFDQVGIAVIDDYTLRINLENSTPYFLDLLGFYITFPVHRPTVEGFGYPAWTKPENIVTNGPFRLKFRRIRDRTRLVKNEYYWNADAVKLNIVDALTVSSDTTMLNMYLTGYADWITQTPRTAVPDLLREGRQDFDPVPFLSTYYYRLNVRKPPLNDPRVRKALSLAMNRKEIVETITQAGEVPAGSLVPPGIAKYESPQGELYNPDRARQLLAEAGYPGGQGMPAVEILFNTLEAHKNIAELIQSQWKKELGIEVRLQNMEWAAYLASTRNGEYLVSRAGWIGDYVDPNTFLDLFVTDGSNNQTGWGNKDYDRLIEECAAEQDPAVRMKMFQQAEAILIEEQPIIPIYYYVTLDMVRPYVKGFYPNVRDFHPIASIWIDEQARAEHRERGER